jgi:hypothetical protein
MLSVRLKRYYGRLRRPPGTTPISRRTPVIGREPLVTISQITRPGRASPVPAATIWTFHAPYAGGFLAAAIQALHRVHGLRRDVIGSAPSTPTLTGGTSNDVAGFASCCGPPSCSPTRALDTGLRPGPFPTRAASLLPGLLTATRTGLTPASDDEHEPADHPTMRSPPALQDAPRIEA